MLFKLRQGSLLKRHIRSILHFRYSWEILQLYDYQISIIKSATKLTEKHESINLRCFQKQATAKCIVIVIKYFCTAYNNHTQQMCSRAVYPQRVIGQNHVTTAPYI